MRKSSQEREGNKSVSAIHFSSFKKERMTRSFNCGIEKKMGPGLDDRELGASLVDTVSSKLAQGSK